MSGYVKLSITEVDNFCRDVNTFKADINAGEGNRLIDPKSLRLIDPKSLLSIMTLDLLKDIKVEIITDDEYEIGRFKELLEKYK